MESFREDFSNIQVELATHKKKLKDVDISIKRLNGSEAGKSKDLDELLLLPVPVNHKLNILNTRERRVTLPNQSSNNRVLSLKRKSTYDTDQKWTHSNKDIKRNTSVNGEEEEEEQQADDSCGEEEDEPSDETRRPTKKIKSSVVSSILPIKTKDDLIKVQNKGANVQRNKRLFGHLLGTLSQFKNDDKVRSSTTKAIHRKELEKKIEVKKIEEKCVDRAEKKKQEEEKYKCQQNIEILETKMELASEFEAWKRGQLQYKKFIRTKSKPFIFYLPKTFDKQAEKLLNETASLIDEQIAKKLKETNAELDALTKKSDILNKFEKVVENKKLQENKENNVGKEDEEEEEEEEECSDDDEMGEETKINLGGLVGADGEEEGEEEPVAAIEMEQKGEEEEEEEEEEEDDLEKSQSDKKKIVETAEKKKLEEGDQEIKNDDEEEEEEEEEIAENKLNE